MWKREISLALPGIESWPSSQPFVAIPSEISRGADKSLAFPIFLFTAQPKELFFHELKKLEQRRHKCVDLRGEYVE
jgi:hypothetical protein